MSDSDIDKAVKDAEKYAEADTKKKESIEVKNQADTIIYSSEKMLDEHKDKVDKATKEKVEKEINELKEVVKTDDTEKIKKQIETINKSLQEIGTKIYQEAAQAQQQTQEKPEEKKEENVVDAEFEKEEKS